MVDDPEFLDRDNDQLLQEVVCILFGKPKPTRDRPEPCSTSVERGEKPSFIFWC
jgi:hypothetical protein